MRNNTTVSLRILVVLLVGKPPISCIQPTPTGVENLYRSDPYVS